MNFHAILSHPWIQNPIMATITVIGLTMTLMAIILTAVPALNLRRKH